MPKEQVQEFKGFVVDNFPTKPICAPGQDFSNGKREHFHLARKGEGVEIVSDGVVDEDALIQSEKCNAGLENIIKLQTLRYGTLENAIKRNEDKQQFADVSNIPTTVAEQAEYLNNIQADVDALCAKLGISKEDLLKSNQESLARMLAAKETSQSANTEGGND